MKFFTTTLLILSISSMCKSQIINLTVNNGIGSGSYFQGDTIHIWSDINPQNEIFTNWSGDVGSIININDWHTTLVVPNNDIIINANKSLVVPLLLDSIEVAGVNNTKTVFYYFDPNPVGTIFFFHGGNGSAQETIHRIESNYFLNEAKYRNYNIILTNSEDRTLGDPDNDGNTRWDLSNWDILDNIDIANCSLIIDSFITSGLLDPESPINAVGVSNGGNFAHMVSFALNFCTTSIFCAQGGSSSSLFNITNIPTTFNIAENDQNAGGGNLGANNNYNILLSRKIPTEINVLKASPLYPERFSRIPGISISLSNDLFNEFDANGMLDLNNYFLISASNFINTVSSSAVDFPIFNSLSMTIKAHIFDQITSVMAEHTMFNNFNNKVFDFLDQQNCSNLTNIEKTNQHIEIKAFPNPTNGKVTLKSSISNYDVLIYSITGELIFQSHKSSFDLSPYHDGMYFIHIQNNNRSHVKKIIKTRN